jgi:hypothetical protein
VEILVEGIYTRYGYDRLVKLHVVNDEPRPSYSCHVCGAMQLVDGSDSGNLQSFEETLRFNDEPAEAFDGSQHCL